MLGNKKSPSEVALGSGTEPGRTASAAESFRARAFVRTCSPSGRGHAAFFVDRVAETAQLTPASHHESRSPPGSEENCRSLLPTRAPISRFSALRVTRLRCPPGRAPGHRLKLARRNGASGRQRQVANDDSSPQQRRRPDIEERHLQAVVGARRDGPFLAVFVLLLCSLVMDWGNHRHCPMCRADAGAWRPAVSCVGGAVWPFWLRPPPPTEQGFPAQPLIYARRCAKIAVVS